MVYVLLDTGLCGRTAYFILDRGFRNSVSGFSKRHAYIYIYIYLVLFCFMDIFWSFILSGSVSLLIIGTSRENYHLCGIYRVRVTGFLSLFSSLSCSTSLLQYKLSSWILILLICLFLCHCK